MLKKKLHHKFQNKSWQYFKSKPNNTAEWKPSKTQWPSTVALHQDKNQQYNNNDKKMPEPLVQRRSSVNVLTLLASYGYLTTNNKAWQ